MSDKKKGISTLAVHGGEPREKAAHAITTPIHQTSTYVFRDTAELCDYMDGKLDRMEYGRYGNPTTRAAELKLAALDHAEDALLFPSGMGAITTTVMALTKAGDHIILTSDSYRRTRQFCLQIMAKFGVETSIVDPRDYDALEKAITPKTKLLFSESPTNPYMNVIDLPKVVAIGKKHRIKIIIDSTFATPFNQTPLDYGVDLVLHSATKYLGGHNDLLGGVITGKKDFIDGIRKFQGILGGIPDPQAAYLLIRGLKTFPLRMARQNESALAIARYLNKHPKIGMVYYPALEHHHNYEVAKAQMRGFGGVVSFEVKATLEQISKFIDNCRIPYIAPSLGGTESLIEQPSLMSFYELSTEERKAVGISDQLVRYAVGVEDTQDLIDDLDQALKVIPG